MFDPSLHLFVDDHHIRNAFALKRVCGQLACDHQPVITDDPGRWVAWGSVMREPDGRFRLWYQSPCAVSAHELATAGVWGREEDFGYYPDRLTGAVPEIQTSMIAYAESDDGCHWIKPRLGLIEWQGTKANNLVLDGTAAAQRFGGAVTNMDSVSVLRDDQEPDPARRYKMICHWETVHCWDNQVSKLDRPQEFIDRGWTARGKYLNTSPDGIHWEQTPVRIKGCAGGGDYCGVTRDERNQRWWFNDRAPVGIPEVGYRTAGLCVSQSLEHWPERVEQILFPGEYEEYGRRYEHHGFVPFNYGDQDLGVLELSIKGRPIAGLLASHRDGQRWQLLSHAQPLLATGPKGARDDSVVAVTRNAPFLVGDRLLFIYNGRQIAPSTSRRQCGMFTGWLRVDGFAGLTIDADAVARSGLPAILQTQPLLVKQPQLQVNIADHAGTARVALLDEGLRPIAGFELESCLPVATESARVPVRWQQQPDLSKLQNQRVTVMIELRAGAIYSVRI